MPVSYEGLLSGLLDLTEQSYAPHPVWSESTTKPVEFTPLPKKAAMRLWQYAREFDRQTKEKGLHGGAVGHTALKVLNTLIFDFLNFATGRLDPSYAAIAKKANLSESAVHTALTRLRDLGILDWVRRCEDGWCSGRYWRRQLTNAYAILPTGWKGYTPPPEPPPPMRATWGAPERMPDILAAAVAAGQTGGPKAQVQALRLGLYGSPKDDTTELAAALAKLGTAVLDSGKP
jgi:hypothetical protein